MVISNFCEKQFALNDTTLIVQAKREVIWLCPMTKAHTPIEKSKEQRDNTQKWSNSSHPMPLVWLNRFISAQPFLKPIF